MSGGATERLDTGGRIVGYLGLAAAAGLAVVWLTQVDEPSPMPVPVLTGTLLAAVLFWSAVVRPAVLVVGDTLVLRNWLETVHIPLAAIEDHALRQVLAIRAGDKKYVASGVGRSLRKTALGSKPGAAPSPTREVDAADFVEERISHLAGEARDRAGIQRYSDEQVALARTVRREPAWPVLAALVASIALFVATLVVA